MNDAKKIIGSCVRALRAERAMTLEGLAAEAELSYQYLSGVENGKENFTIQVLERLASTLNLPLRVLVAMAYDADDGKLPPKLDPKFFRTVPLPEGLTPADLEAAVNHTQSIVHRINRNMQLEIGCTLQSIIQGNNFSGLVSNLLSNSFNECTTYKHNHDQKYPDLICRMNSTEVGLEIKTTVNVGKGGESHNGHSGWHLIACYNFVEDGDIRFVHLMLADLNGHKHAESDWKYVGSTVNDDTGSQRTETYTTNPYGTTKLRDGSAYLDSDIVKFNRWHKTHRDECPPWSIFANIDKKKPLSKRKWPVKR